LQGFLDKNAQVFVLELWKLLLSAQTSLGGIPQQFIDKAKEELLEAKVRCCFLREEGGAKHMDMHSDRKRAEEDSYFAHKKGGAGK
jgi:hypothetical protein